MSLQPNFFRRAYAALYRSQLQFLFKFFSILASPLTYFARKKMAKDIQLSDQEQGYVKSLRSDGFVKLDPDLLNRDFLEAIDRECQQRIDEISASGEPQRLKDFWTYLTDENIIRRSSDPAVALSTQPNILNILTSYMGTAPILDYVLFTRTNSNDGSPKRSQLWHRDYDASQVVKLFVYLNDVLDADYGPFTLIDRKNSEKFKNGFRYLHTNDDQFFEQIERGSEISMTGPKFSSFLVDTTSCYHMGSRTRNDKTRLVFTATFISRPSVYPWRRDRGYKIDTPLSPLQKAALVESAL